MHDAPRPSRVAPTTMAAALLALGSGVVAAAAAYVEIRRFLDPATDAARRGGLVLLGASTSGAGQGILSALTAGLATVTAALALVIGSGILARRPWAREGGFAVFGILAAIVIGVSIQGLSAVPPARNAHWGLAFGVAQAVIVVLLLVKATAADIERADFFRQRQRFAAGERRRQRREAANS